MGRRKFVFFIAWCLLFLFTGFFISGSYAEETKTFKIGLISSMTGSMAPAFKFITDAAKPVSDLMNKRGGIKVNGQKYLVQIVVEDDQSTSAGSVAAANKLLQAGIKFMYAPQFMVSNMAITPIAEENKIFRIKGLGVGTEEVGPKMPYSFYSSNQLYNVPVVYDYLKKNYPKVKKIAIVAPDDPGTFKIQEVTEKEIRRRGYEIVFKEVFKMGSEDFYPILTKALEKKPDAIDMVISIAPWSAGVINQSRELGFKGPIYSNVFADTNILKTMLNPKYVYDIFHAGPDVQSPKMLPIVKDYRVIVERDTKTPLNMDHCLLLEGIYAMLQAVEKAQSFDTTKVASTLEKMKTINTIYGPGKVTGKELFGIDHVVVRPYFMSRLTKDKVEFDFVKK